MSTRDDLRAAESAEAAFWREHEAGNTCRDRGGYYHKGFVDGYKAALAEHPAPEPPSKCDGSFICGATLHEHGCYADEAGFCNHPEDHEPPSGGDCAFGGADDTNPSAGRAGEVTADELAEVIWTTSRADESTISATGANHVAAAILARFDVRRRP